MPSYAQNASHRRYQRAQREGTLGTGRWAHFHCEANGHGTWRWSLETPLTTVESGGASAWDCLRRAREEARRRRWTISNVGDAAAITGTAQEEGEHA